MPEIQRIETHNLQRVTLLGGKLAFHKQGIDILGPFPLALGQLKYLVVAINYFIKWIEAEPFPKIAMEKVRKFAWKRIICRYGIPSQLVTDNGTQFTNWRFEDFCRKLGIRQLFSSVEHPQTNGLVEAANKITLTRLKRDWKKIRPMGQQAACCIVGLPYYTPKKNCTDWYSEPMQ